MELFTEDNSYPVEWDYVSAYEGDWMKNYTQEQQWAEANIKSLQDKMREAYSKPELLERKSVNALELIENFSFSNVGKLMKERLEKL